MPLIPRWISYAGRRLVDLGPPRAGSNDAVRMADLEAAVAGVTLDSDVYAHFAQSLRTRLDPDSVTYANRVMASPPAVGALATSSAIAGGVLVAAGPILAVQNPAVDRQHFTWYAGDISQLGIVSPDYNYMKARYLTDPFTADGGPGAVEFMFDGTTVEILTKGLTNTLWVSVDGEYVAASAISVANTGAQYFLPITFATRQWRKIRVEFNGPTVFGGVQTAAGDTVAATQPSTPFVMVLGDSFSEGGGGGYSSRPWWRTFGNSLGWPNVWSAALGSTGWLAVGPGGRPKLRDRLATDVYPFSPDVLILAAGINDTAFTQQQIQDEVAATLAAIRTNLPNCLPVVVGPFGKVDVSSTDPYWPIRDGARAAAAAAGVMFLDLLEMPAYGAQVTTTLTVQANSGATTITTADAVPRAATIKIGPTQRRRVTTISGTGPYTVTVSPALGATVASGSTVAEVGASLWTTANLALMVGADTTHPTQAGSDAIGVALAQQFARKLTTL